jgi:hypothetical protein
MTEAASTFKTSVNFYETTRRYISEDSHFHTRRRENLKSHKVVYFCSGCWIFILFVIGGILGSHSDEYEDGCFLGC